MNAPTFRTAPNGARLVLDPAAYVARETLQGRTDAGRYLATCAHCARVWDDGHVSGVTPTPGGRCPFEAQHVTARTVDTDTATAAGVGDALAAAMGLARIRTGPNRGRYRLPSGDIATAAAFARTVARILDAAN